MIFRLAALFFLSASPLYSVDQRDPGTLQLIQELYSPPGTSGSPELAFQDLEQLAATDGLAFEAIVRLAGSRPPHRMRNQALAALRRSVEPGPDPAYLPLGTWKALYQLAREQQGVLEGAALGHIEHARSEDLNSVLQVQEYWFGYYQLLDLNQDAVLEPMARRLERELRPSKKSRAWEWLPLRKGSVEHRLRALQLLEKVGPSALARELDLESIKEEGEPALNEAIDRLLSAWDKELLKGAKRFLNAGQLKDMESMIRNMGGLEALRKKDPLLAAFYCRSRERLKHGKSRPSLKEEKGKPNTLPMGKSPAF